MTCKTILKSTALAAVMASASAFSAQAVFFHIGSGSIDGSLCVGNDCVSAEAFGFDTLRLKENNLRIHFDDTSVAAAFPPNDWRLYANDSANGGSSYFGVEDATAGRFVFRVFAGARSNALTVDSQGDVGLGTTTPATDIDIKIGDTPTVRLQQDGTSGFTPQTWDVAGNEAGFFIRDATGGSTLPFRIITGGAPSQSLVIDGDGEIGMNAGTNPEANLHIRDTGGSGGDEMIRLENNGGMFIAFENTTTGNTWNLNHANGTGNFIFSHTVGGGPRLELTSGGDLTVAGDIVSGGGGTCDPGPCDAVFDPEVYTVPSIEDHAAFMWENKHLPAVGPTYAGMQLNVNRKLTGMLNELEHAHIYIEQLNAYIKAQDARIASLEALIVQD